MSALELEAKVQLALRLLPQVCAGRMNINTNTYILPDVHKCRYSELEAKVQLALRLLPQVVRRG